VAARGQIVRAGKDRAVQEPPADNKLSSEVG
jgi:hypothetical protein